MNSNPEVFFFVLPQNGEVCSVDASGALKSGMMKGRGRSSSHR